MAQELDLSQRPYTSLPRRFVLDRNEDETGLSGIGHVAWGVMFPDGRVATRWNSVVAQTCHWDSIADMLAVHSHGGKTKLVWVDEES